MNESEELDRVVQEFLYTGILVELDVEENVFGSPMFTVPPK